MGASSLQTDLNDPNPVRKIFILNKQLIVLNFFLESVCDLVELPLVFQPTMKRFNEAL